jgi:hypothetical protein
VVEREVTGPPPARVYVDLYPAVGDATVARRPGSYLSITPLRTTTGTVIAIRRLLLAPEDPEARCLTPDERCRLRSKGATVDAATAA